MSKKKKDANKPVNSVPNLIQIKKKKEKRKGKIVYKRVWKTVY